MAQTETEISSVEERDLWPSADPLGEALHFLHMDSVLYSRSEFSAPWGLGLPPLPNYLMFHIVLSGRCWLKIGHTSVTEFDDRNADFLNNNRALNY